MYSTRVIETIKRQGAWDCCKVGVFLNEEKIGEYDRNYHSLFDTFFPFQLNGQDLALYSPEYTVTRIMELPSCVDLGGEENSPDGFCPVDYIVPTYIDEKTIVTTNNNSFPKVRQYEKRVNNPSVEQLSESTSSRSYTNGVTGKACTDHSTTRPTSPLIYYPFGFVAGCVWGDDSSWKVQYFDLSQANNGIIKRDERFGYLELPKGLRLKDAVDMYSYRLKPEEDYILRIKLHSVQTFDLDGKLVDPFE